MNASSIDNPVRRRLGLALAAYGALQPWAKAGSSAMAASAVPFEAFGPDTWARLRKELHRPAIVVFTATWCPHCPTVIEALAAAGHARGARLAVVVVDGAGRTELSATLPYRLADRLFHFEGSETVLRHRVDPRWRGVLPYVALLGADASPPVFIAGMPSDEALGRWATRHSSPSSSGSS